MVRFMLTNQQDEQPAGFMLTISCLLCSYTRMCLSLDDILRSSSFRKSRIYNMIGTSLTYTFWSYNIFVTVIQDAWNSSSSILGDPNPGHFTAGKPFVSEAKSTAIVALYLNNFVAISHTNQNGNNTNNILSKYYLLFIYIYVGTFVAYSFEWCPPLTCIAITIKSWY